MDTKWYEVNINSVTFRVETSLTALHEEVDKADIPLNELTDLLFYGYISNSLLRWGYWTGIYDIADFREYLNNESIKTASMIDDFTSADYEWNLYDYGSEFWTFVEQLLNVDIAVAGLYDDTPDVVRISREDFFGIEEE